MKSSFEDFSGLICYIIIYHCVILPFLRWFFSNPKKNVSVETEKYFLTTFQSEYEKVKEPLCKGPGFFVSHESVENFISFFSEESEFYSKIKSDELKDLWEEISERALPLIQELDYIKSLSQKWGLYMEINLSPFRFICKDRSFADLGNIDVNTLVSKMEIGLTRKKDSPVIYLNYKKFGWLKELIQI